jgi:ferredoxin
MSPKVTTTSEISEGVRQDGHTITVDLNQCISAGPCAIAAGNVFKLRKSDGKAVIADPDGDSMEKIMEAALSCPVLAIFIKDKEGRQIYP